MGMEIYDTLRLSRARRGWRRGGELALDTCKYWIMGVMVITTGRRQKLELIIVARGLDFTVNYQPIVYALWRESEASNCSSTWLG